MSSIWIKRLSPSRDLFNMFRSLLQGIMSGVLPEEDPEITNEIGKSFAMDWEMTIATRRLLLILVTLALCVFSLFSCGSCLIIIMILSACLCQCMPLLLFPLLCSSVFFVGSHLQTVERIFRFSEDVMELQEKYK